MSLTIASAELNADHFAVLVLALDLLDQKTADELEKIASGTGEAVARGRGFLLAIESANRGACMP